MRLYFAVAYIVAYAVLLAWAGQFATRKVYRRLWVVGAFSAAVLSLLI